MPKRNAKKSRKQKALPWAGWTDKQLLQTRICDLDVSIENSPLQANIDRLYDEMSARGIRIKPHCWLSDDWFSPDGIPGIAIPFYMAHPRLMRLERKEMLEVEGGTASWCMRILRHEAGHAIDTAYRLNRRKKYRQIFGRYSNPYPEYYRPKPNSRNYVLHLEPWYAQSHPSEDFAETFAVWLKPRSRWRIEYKGWKAIKKIEFVDELMKEISNQPAKLKSRAKVDPTNRIKKTLQQHYDERHERYGVKSPSLLDRDLKKLFSQTPKSRSSKTAASFLQKNRAELSRSVALWTGEYRYNINQVLREMIDRCRALELRVARSEAETKQSTVVMLTVHTMNYLHGGHYRVAL